MNGQTGISSKKARVAIYIRVSTHHQIDKDSLPMQRQDLINYAGFMLGTDDYVIFEDAGYSGKDTDRPKFQEMMAQIRAGAFTHMLVWKIDRISRNLLDFAAMYKELKDLDVTFISKNEQFDTSTAIGEAMLKIILIFAELERNMTSERVTGVMISRASKGQWNGGRVPFGYNWDPDTKEFTINDSEGDLVILIHDMYEEMRSLVRESRALNEKGYRTRAGNLWNPVSLHIILRNVFYCGDYRYNMLLAGDRQKPKDPSEWVTVTDHHVPIVSREQKERVCAILDMNKRTGRARNLHSYTKHTHIFAGLIFCGSCGSPMGARPSNKDRSMTYSKYICPTRRKTSDDCYGKSTSDPVVGEFLFNYILNMLNAQKGFSGIHSPEELQRNLLIGDTFRYIESIDADGLNDLYNMLSSGNIKGEIYGKGVSMDTHKNNVDSELTRLKQEKAKQERALERLTNLYLYSEETMTESEYIIRKSALLESIEEINEEIGIMNSDGWQQSLSDEAFISQASEFIISQKLTDRNYISYRRLHESVDAEVLKSFVQSIVDSIVVDYGYVKQITFRNGLSHTFIFKGK